MTKPTPPDVRFDAKVDRDGPIPVGFDTACWLWTAAKKTTGYGVFSVGPRGSQTHHLAHRWNYERFVGPIPIGLQIDHLCKVRNCVNPAHLEAVPPRVNNARSESPTARNARKTHCPKGHELAGDNLSAYHLKRGERACQRCATEKVRAIRARQR